MKLDMNTKTKVSEILRRAEAASIPMSFLK